jgi:hypothetical protein
MDTEIKLTIILKQAEPEKSTSVVMSLKEAEDLYLKLKDIFDKPKKDLHNPNQIFFRDGEAPLPCTPWHQPGTIPCFTGTTYKMDDMTITCRTSSFGASTD